MNVRKWLGLAGVLVALAAGTAFAQGRNATYKPLAKPQAVESGDKIEVVEFFWYGCSHCFDLEPQLHKWVARLPKDVEFRRIPAVPTERWMAGARTFYTLEALGLLDRLHGEVFDAIHLSHVNLMDEKIQLDWMAGKGVDRAKYADAWKSFSVQSKTRRAVQQTQAYDISGVPTLVVDGKYQTSVSMTGSHEALLKTLDELIARARAERPKKK
ncbi:MAG: Thiol:disulfide interchange protein DsbA [Rhodocyclaceae bacterium]|nr:thiol:disulfide interchange protein DsbA/DsbL [Zoogloeaceae bacterium]MBV6408643.1 Thiol:disulfide interchange protein DsbA [Rhodocyclaceae bacterium]MCK6383274.1 thiol:disulfide interchange protein DsbA/DsbL [Rhodocyclaceae bacterium]